MRRDNGGTVIELLLETGVIDLNDVQAIRSKQKDHLLSLMVDKSIILPSERDQAEELLIDMEEASQTKRLKATTSLVSLITGNLHRRMGRAVERVRKHKERITSGNFPAVKVALKTEG